MRTTTGLVAGVVLGLGALAGCGPEKQLPAKVEVSSERDREQGPAVPDKSDPAAREVIDRAIKAHTDGNPARLAKARLHRMTQKGFMDFQRTEVPTTRTSVAEWPDRLRVGFTYHVPDQQPVTLVINGPRGQIRGGLAEPKPIEATKLEEVRWDVAGLYWAAFLLPFNNPAAVVFSPAEQSYEGKPAKTVRVKLPDHPVWTVAFDPASGLLTRVSFEGREDGVSGQKTLVLSGHKAFDGLVVPVKWDTYYANRKVWGYEVEELSFPGSIDPKEFASP